MTANKVRLVYQELLVKRDELNQAKMDYFHEIFILVDMKDLEKIPEGVTRYVTGGLGRHIEKCEVRNGKVIIGGYVHNERFSYKEGAKVYLLKEGDHDLRALNII